MLERLTRPILFAYSYLRLVNDPNRLDMVFALIDRIAETEVPAEIADHPEVRAFLDRPYEPLTIDLDVLSQLPEGSLGRTYADWMKAQGLSPESLARKPGDTEINRFKDHLSSTHDLWHVVLGFDTDVAGEIGLQAFYFAQLDAPVPIALMSAALLNTLLKAREDGARRMSEIVRGWRLGKRCQPLFGTDWASLWTTPVAEVRRRFGVDEAERDLSEPIAA
ncbi:Coq4 family protein [Haliangium sp.]|uniref:Coq4 family protein n=1 Tax=Haliangium sp. TaxID=2663208 RepID=UPI003D0B93DE